MRRARAVCVKRGEGMSSNPSAASETSPPVEPFHRRLKRLRLAQKLTMNEVSASLGVSAPAVCKWESGGAMPRRSYIAPLAGLLSVSIPELMLGKAYAAAPEQRHPHNDEAASLASVVGACRQLIAVAAHTDVQNVQITIAFNSDVSPGARQREELRQSAD